MKAGLSVLISRHKHILY